jgi:hypothetical protein
MSMAAMSKMTRRNAVELLAGSAALLARRSAAEPSREGAVSAVHGVVPEIPGPLRGRLPNFSDDVRNADLRRILRPLDRFALLR